MDETDDTFENTVAGWLRLAQRDFDCARFLTAMRPMPVEIICFLCQQAGEKLLKGFLTAHAIRPPKIHDLAKLYQLGASCSAGKISPIQNDCDILDDYSVTTRYGDTLDLNETHAQLAITHTAKIYDFLHPLLAGATGENK